jgi:hypothetical protein
MIRLLLNRFVVVPLTLVVIVGGWNVYVSLHDHGLLRGQVVDTAGQPVAGATVVLFTHDFVTQVEKGRTTTNTDGGFRFTDNNSHLVQLQAQQGDQTSPRITIRLWLRAQDRVLRQPLRISPPA